MAQLQEHLLTEALTHANSITQLRIRNHLPPPLSISSILFFHPKKKKKPIIHSYKPVAHIMAAWKQRFSRQKL